MQFVPTWPATPNEVPAEHGDLLALLYEPPLCRTLLEAAEQVENYEACVMWLKAIESRLPHLVNAYLALYHVLEREPRYEEEKLSLVSDVETMQEFHYLLREIADTCYYCPEVPDFVVQHVTNPQVQYWFSFLPPFPNGDKALVYRGCLTG